MHSLIEEQVFCLLYAENNLMRQKCFTTAMTNAVYDQVFFGLRPFLMIQANLQIVNQVQYQTENQLQASVKMDRPHD